MEDINFWLLFLSAAILINISPGPDLIYILTKTVSYGKKVGIASSLGVCTGAIFHVFAASLGISAILVTSAYAFTVVKIIGALYLFYLAYQMFKEKEQSVKIKKELKKEESPLKAFKQGVLIDILNPKVAIFFMAFLPQFVREDHGSIPLQLFYLGLIVIAVAVIIEVSFVLVTVKIAKKIKMNSKISKYLNNLVATVFVVLGIKLLLSSNK